MAWSGWLWGRWVVVAVVVGDDDIPSVFATSVHHGLYPGAFRSEVSVQTNLLLVACLRANLSIYLIFGLITCATRLPASLSLSSSPKRSRSMCDLLIWLLARAGGAAAAPASSIVTTPQSGLFGRSRRFDRDHVFDVAVVYYLLRMYVEGNALMRLTPLFPFSFSCSPYHLANITTASKGNNAPAYRLDTLHAHLLVQYPPFKASASNKVLT